MFVLAMIILATTAHTLHEPVNLVGNGTSLGNTDPCERAKPYAEKVTNFSKTTVCHTALSDIQNKAIASPAYEFSIAFGTDAIGNVITSGISTGGKSSGNIPGVANGFADVHNHPNNTPPSSGDLYGLIWKNQKNKNYDTRFVIMQDGSMYAFVVTDTIAASAFLLKYPPQQKAGYSPLFPDALLNEYRAIQYKYDAREEMAMAYILEKYEAGVSLLKQDEKGDFKKLRTLLSEEDNHLVFVAHNCP